MWSSLVITKSMTNFKLNSEEVDLVQIIEQFFKANFLKYFLKQRDGLYGKINDYLTLFV